MLKKVVAFKKGRKCKYPGCKQVLSIYNYGTYCHLHADKPPEKYKLKIR